MSIDDRIAKLQNRLDFFYDKDIAFQIDMLKAIKNAREEIRKATEFVPTENGVFDKGKAVGHIADINILDKHIEEIISKYE